MLLFIRALTPLHVGAGRGVSIHVDLPLQRDEFDFPTIWASSLKGALRANVPDSNLRKVLFGPEPGSGELESSPVSITDARLLLIPARILTGVWSYATSPHMLSQLNTLLSTMNKGIVSVPRPPQGKAVVSKKDLLLRDARGREYVTVNEISFEAIAGGDETLKTLGNVLPDELRKLVEEKGLIVIPDEHSRMIVNRSLVIQYRVRLKSETKTVEEGPWSEEYLPSETIMASLIICKDGKMRKEGSGESKVEKISSAEVCNMLRNSFRELNYTIYVGGKETIGKGLVKLYFM